MGCQLSHRPCLASSPDILDVVPSPMTCDRSSRTSAPASLTDKGHERHIGTVVMRRIRLVLTVSFSLLVVYSAQLRGQVVIDLPLNEPEVFSIFPLGGLRGTVFEAELRGRFLDDAY